MPSSRPPSLSPPPLKRRRISRPPSTSPPNPLHSSTTTSKPLLSPHDLNTLRILTWNISGIEPFLPARSRTQEAITNFFLPSKPPIRSHDRSIDRKPSLRRCLRRWAWPHVVCLQEVKIARSDTRTQDAVRRMVAQPSHDHHTKGSEDEGASDTDDGDEDGRERGEGVRSYDYDAHFSLPRDTHNARGLRGSGKVYGVCTLIRRDVPCDHVAEAKARGQQVETKEVDWDLEGRVLVTSIPSAPPSPSPSSSPAMPQQKGLMIFNIYAVNGTTNPYHDPKTGLVAGDRHGHKRRFHTHIARAVRSYEDEGWDVVVAGDLNIAREARDSFPALRLGEEHVRNRRDFEEKFIEAGEGGPGMVDTFRYLRGGERKYTYRPKEKAWGAGMDRVDLILCSRGMVEWMASETRRDEGGGDNEVGAGEGKGERRGWRLINADILDSPEERGPSDHVPLFVDILYETLE